jgi:predicted nucleic acid-binding protein
MDVLIDTSLLIGYERKRMDLAAVVNDRSDDSFIISAITASELLHGVHRALDPGQRARRSAWVEALLAQTAILPIDLPTARTHARLWAELAAEGRMIGAHDMWLAASAITHGLGIATLNLREFERVPGLVVERW